MAELTVPRPKREKDRGGSNGNYGNGSGRSGSSPPGWEINKALFGLLMFIGSEVMIFAGLISSYLILRAGADSWPPAGQPRLPIGVTGGNTLVLMFSLFTVYRAAVAIRNGDSGGTRQWLTFTAVLGAVFLGIQGFEWWRMVGFGMTYSSSMFGATFYTLIGFHALHVLGAMIGLLFVLRKVALRKYSTAEHTGVLMCATYWCFVVIVWPVLYGLVYLA